MQTLEMIRLAGIEFQGNGAELMLCTAEIRVPAGDLERAYPRCRGAVRINSDYSTAKEVTKRPEVQRNGSYF